MHKVTLPAKAEGFGSLFHWVPWEAGIGFLIIHIANLITCFTGIPLLPAEYVWDGCPIREEPS
jgi:hypothetical protein